jgi:hypothetical protein
MQKQLDVRSVNGKQLTTTVFEGEYCWTSRELGEILGYRDLGWAIRNQRVGKLVEGKHFSILKREKLANFKKIIADTRDDKYATTAQIMVVYLPGIDILCRRIYTRNALLLRKEISKIVHDFENSCRCSVAKLEPEAEPEAEKQKMLQKLNRLELERDELEARLLDQEQDQDRSQDQDLDRELEKFHANLDLAKQILDFVKTIN